MKTHRFHNSLRVCVCVNKTFFFSKINTYRSLYSITFLFWPYSHTSHKHNNKWVYITKLNKRNFHAFNRFFRNQIQKDECAKDILRETQQKNRQIVQKDQQFIGIFMNKSRQRHDISTCTNPNDKYVWVCMREKEFVNIFFFQFLKRRDNNH